MSRTPAIVYFPLVAVLVGACATQPTVKHLTLVDEGKSTYSIVVSPSAPAPERFAADWNEINMYLYPRLTWEPWRSSTSLVEDYCRRAYGDATAPMIRHWLILQEAKEKYPLEKSRCLALLDKAEKMTSDSVVLRRIQELREIWSRVPEA